MGLDTIEKKEHVVINGVDKASYLQHLKTMMTTVNEASTLFIEAMELIINDPENEGHFKDSLSSMLTSYKASVENQLSSPAEKIAPIVLKTDAAIIQVDNTSIK